MKTYRRRVLAVAIAALLLFGLIGFSSIADAASVAPEFIPGTQNMTCSSFAGAGQTWTELKVDPNADGVYSDGTLTVTISNTTGDKVFDFSANLGVDAVFVKAGETGSYLYRYDPPSEVLSDSDLTSPGGGTTNQISHISFCYDIEPPTNTPTNTATNIPYEHTHEHGDQHPYEHTHEYTNRYAHEHANQHTDRYANQHANQHTNRYAHQHPHEHTNRYAHEHAHEYTDQHAHEYTDKHAYQYSYEYSYEHAHQYSHEHTHQHPNLHAYTQPVPGLHARLLEAAAAPGLLGSKRVLAVTNAGECVRRAEQLLSGQQDFAPGAEL